MEECNEFRVTEKEEDNDIIDGTNNFVDENENNMDVVIPKLSLYAKESIEV